MRLRAFRPILINIAALLVSVTVTVLFCEWALRFLNIQRVVSLAPPIYRNLAPSSLSYDLRPSVNEYAFGELVRTDTRGFRTVLGPIDKPLIAILGDSIAFGWGLSNAASLPQQLQNSLPNFTVLNAAVPGYNIGQEVQQYKEKVAPLHPTALVLVFYFNDFDETYAMDTDGSFYPQSQKPTLSLADRICASVNKPGTIPIPFKCFLQTHSSIFGLVERATKHSGFRRQSAPDDIFADPITPEMLSIYRKHLHELSVQSKNVEKLFVIWPENALHLTSRPSLKRIAEQEGFHVLDLYEIIGNSYDSLGWDSHPNAATIQKLTPLIIDALKHFGIVDAS